VNAARLKMAMAIVGQVLVHFGAGYGAKAQIFKTPKDSQRFTNHLLSCTLANLDLIDWDINPGLRDRVCDVAYKHGKLAKRRAGTNKLTWAVIHQTLNEIQNTECPSSTGGGGGLVCSF